MADDKDDKIEELEEELCRSEKNNKRQREYARKLEYENRDLKKTKKAYETPSKNGGKVMPEPPEKPDNW